MRFFTSNTILILVVLLVSYVVLHPPLHGILSWDILAHYIYLPLAFDQHNLVLHGETYLQGVNEIYHVSPTFYQFVGTPDGVLVSKCTMGWALLQLPFYGIAELWASLGNYPTDGFSEPYQVMMYVGAWFYSMLALVFTRKVLLHFFTDRMTAFLLLLMVFGTNLYFMYYESVGQSNHFALFATALMVWRIICFYKNPVLRNAIWFGCSWALLALIRPPDGILGLLFFLWNVNAWGDFKTRFIWFFKTNRTVTLVVAGSFIVMFIPQMLYWYASTGSFLINSYSNNNGEGLDFVDPYLWEFLFSFRKGWLLYTPLMLFAFLGAFIMVRKSNQGRAFSLVSFLFLYVIASWTCWWYGSSFSSRAAIDMYPLCMVLVGFALAHLFQSKWRVFTGVLITLFLSLNLAQTYQATYNILNLSFATREYYFSTFLQFTPPTPAQLALLAFDRDRAYAEGFSAEDKRYQRVCILEDKFQQPQEIYKENEYAEEFFIPVRDHVHKSHVWIKTTWTCEGSVPAIRQTVFYVSTLYGNERYSWQGFAPDDGNTQYDTLTGEVSFYYLTPNIRTTRDRIMFGAMNHGDVPAGLTSRRIEIFEPIIDYQ